MEEAGRLSAAACAQDLRQQLVTSCDRILSQYAAETKIGIILSGGVDTGSVLVACEEARKLNARLPKVTHAITVLASETAPDREFADHIAKSYGLVHEAVMTTPQLLIQDCLKSTIQVLQSFDPMTIRNSLVIERALMEAEKFKDVKLWLTGDAADELFGGYSFTWKAEDPLWTEKRDRMCFSSTFTADDLSQARRLTVLSPFREETFFAWAIRSCPRSVCLGERELVIKVGDKPQKMFTGKINLRDAFPENLSANRRKDPIEIGSGSTALSHPDFFSSIVPQDERVRVKAVAKEMGFELTSMEHEVYFDCFILLFPELKDLKVKRLTQNAALPMIGYCNGCAFQLPREDSEFCRTCGKWPAQILAKN